MHLFWDLAELQLLMLRAAGNTLLPHLIDHLGGDVRQSLPHTEEPTGKFAFEVALSLYSQRY